jgi:hypothetical protein
MKKFFWKFLCKLYNFLYFEGLKLSKPYWLINKPIKKLELRHSEFIWADAAFLPEERQLILQALDDINYFCNGLVSLQLKFGLDNYDPEVIKDYSVLLRVTAEHPAIIASDERISADTSSTGKTAGLCALSEFPNNYTRKLYLVVDRMLDPVVTKVNSVMFKTTATHELGHFIGMDHTDKQSIMHKVNYANCLYPSYLDAKEMAARWKISPEDLCYFKL